MRGAWLAVAVGLDARLVARPSLVELLAGAGLSELPFAEPGEIALDHRLDVDARPSRADHDARHPAARVRDARAETAGHLHAAVGGRVERQSLAEPLQQAARGEELTPALGGAKAREAPAIERAEAAPGARQRRRAEIGDARRGYPGVPCHRRNTRLALVPPKPRLLLITAPSLAARILSTIGRPRIAGSGSSRLAQAAMKSRSIISRQ